MQTPRPIRIFCSYAHRDDKLRDRLEVSLAMLRREGLISDWYDRKIVPGQDIDIEVDGNLRDADVILLLVSPSFLNSDYCFSKEMTRAIEMHESGEARVVPIVVRAADWHTAPFGKLKALPKDGRAVMSWSNKDEAWVDVAKGIRAVVADVGNVTRRVSTARVREEQPLDGGSQSADETAKYPESHRSHSLRVHGTISRSSERLVSERQKVRPTAEQLAAINQDIMEAVREDERQSAADLPHLVPIGSALRIHGAFVPQRLDAEAEQQRITLQNQGRNMPTEVRLVLFPNAANLPPGAPRAARVDELFGTYWEGSLDATLAPGEQREIILNRRHGPLYGSLRLLNRCSLFAPPIPNTGTLMSTKQPYYFGRLTVTFRYPVHDAFAIAFDGQSVAVGNGLTQMWVRVAGPLMVPYDLGALTSIAARERRPRVYTGE